MKAVAIGLVVVLACACHDKPDTTTVQGAPLPPLPDLTGLDESSQERIRSEYVSLEQVVRAADRSKTGEAFGHLGMLLLAADRQPSADPFLAAAEAINGSDRRWPYYRGHVHLALRDPAAAVEYFERARQRDPRHLPSLLWLAETYLMLGKPADADWHLAAAVAMDPASVAGWFGRGRAALAVRDYAHAVEYLERALAIDPAADPIHYQLGLAYRGLGDTGRAAAHLARRGNEAILPVDAELDALRASLNGSAAYLNRGVEALDRRDWATAVANLRKATELSPRDAGAQLNLGTALFLAGDRPAARAAFESAIRAAPDLPKPHYTLALLAESDKRDAEAIEQFTAAVRLDPNYAEAHASLADALRRSGRVEESLTHYAKVLAANPGASQARFGYAMGLIRLNKYVEARDWLKEASRLHPDQPGFAHALARVLAAAPDDRVRDGHEAARLTDALLHSSMSWTLLETRAMAAAEVGQFEEAVRLQTAAIAGAVAAGEKRAAAHLQRILARYRLKLPCRTPWSPDDPVFAPRPTT